MAGTAGQAMGATLVTEKQALRERLAQESGDGKGRVRAVGDRVEVNLREPDEGMGKGIQGIGLQEGEAGVETNETTGRLDEHNTDPTFSIRSFVQSARLSDNVKYSWPFSQKFLRPYLARGKVPLLPPFDLPRRKLVEQFSFDNLLAGLAVYEAKRLSPASRAADPEQRPLDALGTTVDSVDEQVELDNLGPKIDSLEGKEDVQDSPTLAPEPASEYVQGGMEKDNDNLGAKEVLLESQKGDHSDVHCEASCQDAQGGLEVQGDIENFGNKVSLEDHSDSHNGGQEVPSTQDAQGGMGSHAQDAQGGMDSHAQDAQGGMDSHAQDAQGCMDSIAQDARGVTDSIEMNQSQFVKTKTKPRKKRSMADICAAAPARTLEDSPFNDEFPGTPSESVLPSSRGLHRSDSSIRRQPRSHVPRNFSENKRRRYAFDYEKEKPKQEKRRLIDRERATDKGAPKQKQARLEMTLNPISSKAYKAVSSFRDTEAHQEAGCQKVPSGKAEIVSSTSQNLHAKSGLGKANSRGNGKNLKHKELKDRQQEQVCGSSNVHFRARASSGTDPKENVEKQQEHVAMEVVELLATKQQEHNSGVVSPASVADTLAPPQSPTKKLCKSNPTVRVTSPSSSVRESKAWWPPAAMVRNMMSPPLSSSLAVCDQIQTEDSRFCKNSPGLSATPSMSQDPPMSFKKPFQAISSDIKENKTSSHLLEQIPGPNIKVTHSSFSPSLPRLGPQISAHAGSISDGGIETPSEVTAGQQVGAGVISEGDIDSNLQSSYRSRNSVVAISNKVGEIKTSSGVKGFHDTVVPSLHCPGTTGQDLTNSKTPVEQLLVKPVVDNASDIVEAIEIETTQSSKKSPTSLVVPIMTPEKPESSKRPCQNCILSDTIEQNSAPPALPQIHGTLKPGFNMKSTPSASPCSSVGPETSVHSGAISEDGKLTPKELRSIGSHGELAGANLQSTYQDPINLQSSPYIDPNSVVTSSRQVDEGKANEACNETVLSTLSCPNSTLKTPASSEAPLDQKLVGTGALAENVSNTTEKDQKLVKTGSLGEIVSDTTGKDQKMVRTGAVAEKVSDTKKKASNQSGNIPVQQLRLPCIPVDTCGPGKAGDQRTKAETSSTTPETEFGSVRPFSGLIKFANEVLKNIPSTSSSSRLSFASIQNLNMHTRLTSKSVTGGLATRSSAVASAMAFPATNSTSERLSWANERQSSSSGIETPSNHGVGPAIVQNIFRPPAEMAGPMKAGEPSFTKSFQQALEQHKTSKLSGEKEVPSSLPGWMRAAITDQQPGPCESSQAVEGTYSTISKVPATLLEGSESSGDLGKSVLRLMGRNVVVPSSEDKEHCGAPSSKEGHMGKMSPEHCPTSGPLAQSTNHTTVSSQVHGGANNWQTDSQAITSQAMAMVSNGHATGLSKEGCYTMKGRHAHTDNYLSQIDNTKSTFPVTGQEESKNARAVKGQTAASACAGEVPVVPEVIVLDDSAEPPRKSLTMDFLVKCGAIRYLPPHSTQNGKRGSQLMEIDPQRIPQRISQSELLAELKKIGLIPASKAMLQSRVPRPLAQDSSVSLPSSTARAGKESLPPWLLAEKKRKEAEKAANFIVIDDDDDDDDDLEEETSKTQVPKFSRSVRGSASSPRRAPDVLGKVQLADGKVTGGKKRDSVDILKDSTRDSVDILMDSTPCSKPCQSDIQLEKVGLVQSTTLGTKTDLKAGSAGKITPISFLPRTWMSGRNGNVKRGAAAQACKAAVERLKAQILAKNLGGLDGSTQSGLGRSIDLQSHMNGQDHSNSSLQEKDSVRVEECAVPTRDGFRYSTLSSRSTGGLHSNVSLAGPPPLSASQPQTEPQGGLSKSKSVG